MVIYAKPHIAVRDNIISIKCPNEFGGKKLGNNKGNIVRKLIIVNTQNVIILLLLNHIKLWNFLNYLE